MSNPHTRDNKHGVVVMDRIKAKANQGDEWSPWSTVQWNKERGFFIQFMFSPTIYLVGAYEVEILRRWGE